MDGTELADRFKFRRSYGGVYTNNPHRFVLRTEHFAQLKALMESFNRNRPYGVNAIGVSDIVNACLDYIFEHDLDFSRLVGADGLRDEIAAAVEQKRGRK